MVQHQMLMSQKRKKAKDSKSRYVGNRIAHRWEDQHTKKQTWYYGHVIRALGNEKEEDCLYEIKYDGDDELYEVSLQNDKGNVVVMPL